MLGKPGIDVAWLIEEWFVRLILDLLRRGNKLVYTTRGLYQTSYHSLGEGTKTVISVQCRGALGHHWSEGNFQQFVHGVSGMDTMAFKLVLYLCSARWCSAFQWEIKHLPVSMLLLSSFHGVFDTCGEYALSSWKASVFWKIIYEMSTWVNHRCKIVIAGHVGSSQSELVSKGCRLFNVVCEAQP